MLILRTEAEDPKWLLPAFEDGLVAFLKVLGVTSPIIIGLVLLAFSVKSWIDALFLGKRLVGRARVTADATRQHLYAIGPLRIALASSVTTAVIAAQLITLALMLLAGTLASALEELATLGPGWETSGSRAAQNYLAFQAAWTEDGINGLILSRFYATLAFDDAIIAILVVGTIGLLGSYCTAHTRAAGNCVVWGLVMALPLSSWLCVYTCPGGGEIRHPPLSPPHGRKPRRDRRIGCGRAGDQGVPARRSSPGCANSTSAVHKVLDPGLHLATSRNLAQHTAEDLYTSA